VLGPPPNKLDDLAHEGTFAPGQAWTEVVFTQAVFRAVVGSRPSFLENGAIVQIAKRLHCDGHARLARVIEHEVSRHQLLEMYLISDNLNARIAEESVSAVPRIPAHRTFLENGAIMLRLAHGCCPLDGGAEM
jgi:hypothetical protein